MERLDDPDPDGWLRVRLKLDWPNEVVSQILAVGPDCELLEPVELRDKIGTQARRVASYYDPAAGPVPAASNDKGKAGAPVASGQAG
jgi:hypothetical protein